MIEFCVTNPMHRKVYDVLSGKSGIQLVLNLTFIIPRWYLSDQHADIRNKNTVKKFTYIRVSSTNLGKKIELNLQSLFGLHVHC